MPLSSHLPLGSVKASVAIVSPDAMPGRCSFLAASSPECSSAEAASTHGAEVRRAQQGPAHLLEHDGELDEGEALAAVLLRDDQALEAELVGHLAPHGGVVALVGVHEAADLGLGRLALEELAGDAAELFLLLGEGEVHGRRFYGPGPASFQPAMCTHVYASRVEIGTRELRANLAAALRQVGAGERLVITVDGRPVAQLGPLEPTGAPTLPTWPRPASSSPPPSPAAEPPRRRHRRRRPPRPRPRRGPRRVTTRPPPSLCDPPHAVTARRPHRSVHSQARRYA